jgi:hypothetical protein
LALVSPHQHPWRSDVGDLQRCALGQAPPTGVDQLPTHPGCRVLDHGQEGPDLPPAQHDGPLLGVSGSNTVEDGPRSLQRALGEEPDPREVNPEGPLRDRLVVAQAAEGLAELVFTDLVRSAPVVWRQMLHGFEVTRLGPRGQAPEWQVFQQTASERGHRHPPVRGEHQGSEWSTRIRKINGRSA